MHLQENTLFDLDLHRNVPQYPLHHVTYIIAKFEVAMSKRSRRRNIYKKILYLPLTLASRSHKMLLSTDLCTCEFWSCYVQWFRRRCIYKKMYNLTFGLALLKYRPLSSTSCDLCFCKVWSYYVQQLRRICIYKKKHYLTFIQRSRSHELLPNETYAPAKFEVATSNS